MAWLKKPTWRLALCYAGILILIYFSRMTPTSLAVGLVPIIVGQAIRVWAAGHLVKNKRLTTTGPYAYVKNPLYLGAITIVIGFCIVGMPPWWLYVVFLAAFFLYYMPRKMKIEGDRLRAIYGEAYTRYDQNVPDMLPRATAYRSGDTTRWSWAQTVDNSEHGTIMSLGVGLGLMLLRSWLGKRGILV
ncbi:MAG TPA: isoprenylcysteine carboxylmethyltransferase family protein [Candidatus Polarisedimenticolia bacterium]|nr:isoprenylcysteine carboxylmethyltransferase family protein [Candidatus Polarisedimenticolia bacterium]